MSVDYRKFVSRGETNDKFWIDYWDPEREPPPKIVRKEFNTLEEADIFYNEIMSI